MKQLEQFAAFSDIPMLVEVELDRRIITVRDVLRLDVDTVLKMNRSAGENLDVSIGGTLIGYGEVVTSETGTGVRITDLLAKD